MSEQWRYAVNKAGRIVELNAKKYDEVINDEDQSFRPASQAEIENYLLKRNVRTVRFTGTDVYLASGAGNGGRTDGYAVSIEWLERELALNNVRVSREYTGQKVGLAYGYPYHLEQMPTPIKVLYTMFESSAIPEEWIPQLALADLIIVPSKFCQEAFKVRGIETVVIPLGYDQEVYKWIERKPKLRKNNDPFTFLMYDAFNERKNWRAVLHAFADEFKPEENAKLILKTVRQPKVPIIQSEYPGVTVVKQAMNEGEMRNLLGQADAFVFPSHGEGFGLPPLEAAATGLPVIVPNGSGMSEYVKPEHFVVVPHTEDKVPLYDQWKGKDVGHMIDVKVPDLRKAMRNLFEMDFKERRVISQNIAVYAQQFSIKETGKKMARVLRDFSTKPAVIAGKRNIGGKRIAVIMDQINFYSGGRYLNWIQALMLHHCGFDVTIYTNATPPFVRDFDLYATPPIEIVQDLNALDVEADIYFGSPEPGMMIAAKLGKMYSKKVIVQMFDPPAWMENNSHVDPNEYSRDIRFREWLQKNGPVDLTLITLTENARQAINDFYDIGMEKIFSLHPAVNSRVINLFSRDEKIKRKWVVAVNRNHIRKAWDEVFLAFAPFAREYQLHVITNSKHRLTNMAADAGIAPDRIVFHEGITDLEKFKIMAMSRALISASHFEGFGMWAIEGLSMGIPVACYDLEPLKEVDSKGIHRAEIGLVSGLSKQLGAALQHKIMPETTWDFETIAKRMKDIFEDKIINESPSTAPKKEVSTKVPDKGQNKQEGASARPAGPSLTVITMVLNEEKFVRAYLENMIKWPEIKQIILVEGADKRHPGANTAGLSSDNTAKKVRYTIAKYQKKGTGPVIHYERVGYVPDKAELKNKGIDIMREQYEKTDWVLFADVDEVFTDSNWRKLTGAMRKNPQVGAIYYRHHHFWKSLKQVTIGGQWDSKLFRLWRDHGDEVWVDFHGGEPVMGKEKTKVGDKYGRIELEDVWVHHYGAMKDQKDIQEKLELYRRRDHNLNIRDTWSEWKPGEPTQWTHGGGEVEKYSGDHPPEIVEMDL